MSTVAKVFYLRKYFTEFDENQIYDITRGHLTRTEIDEIVVPIYERLIKEHNLQPKRGDFITGYGPGTNNEDFYTWNGDKIVNIGSVEDVNNELYMKHV